MIPFGHGADKIQDFNIKLRKKKIYYYAYADFDTGSTRYRGYYPLREMASRFKIDHKIITPRTRYQLLVSYFEIFFINRLKKIKTYVVFQKICYKNKYYYSIYPLFYFFKKKYVYDIDDAMYLIEDSRVVESFIQNAKAVTVASAFLLEFAQKMNANSFLLTTPCADSNHKKEMKNEKFNVGWIGYFGIHKSDLFEILFPVIKKLKFQFRFTILGVENKEDLIEIEEYFKECKNMEIFAPLKIDWLNENYLSKEISKFDIGVAPLSDTEINRAKSAFKIKQYLSSNVPVLASPVGENRNFIIDGVNGFLCESSKDFDKYINFFYDLNPERFRNFLEGISKTTTSFSLDHYCEKFMIIVFDKYKELNGTTKTSYF